jgi:peptide/nickel transport system permease protein
VVTAFPVPRAGAGDRGDARAGLTNFYIAISLVSWVAYARIVRGEALSARGAATSWPPGAWDTATSGSCSATSAERDRPALVFGMSDFVLDILAGPRSASSARRAAADAEWGVMIAEGRNFILTAPWVVIFPGLATIVTSFFVSLVGDSASDIVRRVHAT